MSDHDDLISTARAFVEETSIVRIGGVNAMADQQLRTSMERLLGDSGDALDIGALHRLYAVLALFSSAVGALAVAVADVREITAEDIVRRAAREITINVTPDE